MTDYHKELIETLKHSEVHYKRLGAEIKNVPGGLSYALAGKCLRVVFSPNTPDEKSCKLTKDEEGQSNYTIRINAKDTKDWQKIDNEMSKCINTLELCRSELKRIQSKGIFITDLDVAFSLDWLKNDAVFDVVDKKLLEEKETEIFDMAKSLYEKAGTGEYMNNADTAVCAAYLAHKAVEGTNIEPYDILDTMFSEGVFDGSDENSTVSLDHFDKEAILQRYHDDIECEKEMASLDDEEMEI